MRDMVKTYMQPAFLICAAVLVTAGSGMSIAVKRFGVYLKKEPLPLKKSLDLLDENALAPYKVVNKRKIENEQIVKELGTEDYIEWILEDPDAAADSPVRKCSLFITYYEIADKRVTHVPDECYIGVGFQRFAIDGVTFKIDGTGGEEKLPGRYVVFSSTKSGHWQGDTRFLVLYLFYVNGKYAGSRQEARFIANKSLFSKFSYYSKVEWKFFNRRLGEGIYPGKEEAIAASEKLLAVILPILKREHWPDWPVANGK